MIFFKFLSDPNLNRLNKRSKQISEAITYFFNLLDLEEIINRVENIVITNFNRLEDLNKN